MSLFLRTNLRNTTHILSQLLVFRSFQNPFSFGTLLFFHCIASFVLPSNTCNVFFHSEGPLCFVFFRNFSLSWQPSVFVFTLFKSSFTCLMYGSKVLCFQNFSKVVRLIFLNPFESYVPPCSVIFFRLWFQNLQKCNSIFIYPYLILSPTRSLCLQSN